MSSLPDADALASMLEARGYPYCGVSRQCQQYGGIAPDVSYFHAEREVLVYVFYAHGQPVEQVMEAAQRWLEAAKVNDLDYPETGDHLVIMADGRIWEQYL